MAAAGTFAVCLPASRIGSDLGKWAAVLGVLVVLAASSPAPRVAAAGTGKSFNQWVSEFRIEALAAGISAAVFDRAFRKVRPDPAIARSDVSQPEFARTIWDYLDKAVSARRVSVGRRKLRQTAATLNKLEKRFGVSRYALAAIWGVESAYGRIIGRKYVIRSLATAAYRGRRQAFGRRELLAALAMLERGDVTPGKFVGSWAGAVGQTQMLPSAYNKFAVDFDGDKRRDVWTTPGDALASAANLLRSFNWRAGEPVLHEIVLPKDFNYRLSGIDKFRPVSQWAAMGVVRARRIAFGATTRPGAVILPAGAKGPAFMIYRNFHVVRLYNKSTAYALAVGHLANRLRGDRPLVTAWPRRQKRLSIMQLRELQQRLIRRGADTGGADGRVGPKTRRAVSVFQQQADMVADGHPSPAVLERLRRDDL